MTSSHWSPPPKSPGPRTCSKWTSATRYSHFCTRTSSAQVISVTALLLLRHPLLLQNRVDLPRRDRNINVRHPEMRQRIHDGVDDGGRGADGGGLADAFGAEGVVGRGGYGLVGLPGWSFHRGRDQVVHERPVQVVAVRVVL